MSGERVDVSEYTVDGKVVDLGKFFFAFGVVDASGDDGVSACDPPDAELLLLMLRLLFRR